MFQKQTLRILLSCVFTLSPQPGCQTQALTEQYLCNDSITNNLGINPVESISYYGIASAFLCAGLCLRKPSCVMHRYCQESATCAGYDSIFSLLLKAHQQICKKANYVPSTITTTMVPTPTVRCPKTLITYSKPGTSCATLRNCVCNVILSAPQAAASTPDICYNTCATNNSCLAFSFGTVCRMATEPLHLATKSFTNSLLCYC